MDSTRLAPTGGHVLRSSKSSNLTDQLQKEREAAKIGKIPIEDNGGSRKEELGLRTPTKLRSVSDVFPPSLSPSPVIVEASRLSKDDTALVSDPITPRRPFLSARGLSLQMPGREAGNLHNAGLTNRAPLSPKLDSINTYGSAATVLPRRSRGLDFSRACTNLHHSTLADQSSPDSSPVMPGRGMMIPPRKGYTNTSHGAGSPGSVSNSLWSTIANLDRSNVASSMGSVTMMDSDSPDSSSTDDDLIEPDPTEDPILTTPQVYKISSGISQFNPPFQNSNAEASPGRDWMGGFSPAAASLMSFQRARLRKGKSRKSSSSASISGGSSLASPTPASPPILKSVESAGGPAGYFARELAKSRGDPRRSSLSLGTRDLHISSGGESDDGRPNEDQVMGEGSSKSNTEGQDLQAVDEKRAVVRRPVTRRGNLLPKTKNFARIRAALMEEGAPVDTEVRREAEVVRQVRESDPDLEASNLGSDSVTGNSSPTMPPAVLGLEEALDGIPVHGTGVDQSKEKRHSDSFNQQSTSRMGKNFWESLGRLQTPPPLQFNRRRSSIISEDLNMDSPSASLSSVAPIAQRPPSLHLATEGHDLSGLRSGSLPTAAEVSQKINNKRRRDDDFDVASFKRRAVSPSVSVQNSPILQQSPAQKDGSWWTAPKTNREASHTCTGGQAGGDRANSGNGGMNSNGSAPKRIGFQGMVDTSDGLMNMSIE